MICGIAGIYRNKHLTKIILLTRGIKYYNFIPLVVFIHFLFPINPNNPTNDGSDNPSYLAPSLKYENYDSNGFCYWRRNNG